ncbi:hypothetical protein [Metabacillus malikii]|uniref:SMODS-associating 2TM beta-strand rich effector domain-containing protein n=1 Tax=Metabacillus malikii TaxID=1504265 RepID=A0ABT9ZAT4_9BACI|nr:hypothetical protein [Metabacillus malikii]MDQ0229110.1 hypothetical protein [Metabacillus malikii]
MIELILLFALLLLTQLARYLVYGAFEPLTFASLFLLPASSYVLYLVSKKFADKERAYQPKNIKGWSFYNIQKSLMIKKPLFHGDRDRGYIKRYFPKKWQYAFADIFGFNWYLCLEISIDNDTYNVQWYRKKWFTNQEHWYIFKNGVQIGSARTLVNLKNTSKLKESISFAFTDTEYVSQATTISTTIQLTENDRVIGTLKRNHLLSNVQVIDVKEDQQEALIALIVHSYNFK